MKLQDSPYHTLTVTVGAKGMRLTEQICDLPFYRIFLVGQIRATGSASEGGHGKHLSEVAE